MARKMSEGQKRVKRRTGTPNSVATAMRNVALQQAAAWQKLAKAVPAMVRREAKAPTRFSRKFFRGGRKRK